MPKEKIKKHKKRLTATKSAANVASFVKHNIEAPIAANKEGRPTCYSFIISSYDEIIRAMDVTPAWTESFAGICAAKRDSARFLEKAEEFNFSRSLCTYALCGLGFDIMREQTGEMPSNSPWGGQARPDFMLSSAQNICDPRGKWYQAAQEFMPDVPIYNTGLQWPVFEEDVNVKDVEEYYVKYHAEELRGLVKFMEKQTGTKMDWDKLSETVNLVERTWDLIWDTYELRRAVPTPMDTGDAMNTMVPMVFLSGTQRAYDFFLELNKELKEKIANNEGVAEEEKYRLMWGGGLPSWFALNDFNYFHSKGAVFPVEITYRIIEPMNRLNIPDTNDPIERIAWRHFRFNTFWYERARQRPGSVPALERLIQYIEDYKIDGIVMHLAFSCRTAHLGLTWQLSQLAKIYKPIPVLITGGDKQTRKILKKEVPSLIMESDIVDISSYSEVETRAMIDAFIDTLADVKSKKV